MNLSDLAAMGASPACAFSPSRRPPGFDHRRFFQRAPRRLPALRHRGSRAAISRSPHGVTAALTLLGTKAEAARWLRRDGARPGHGLWLGGTVGESAAGRMLIERGAAAPRSSSRASFFARSRAESRPPAPAAACPQLDLGRWLGTSAGRRGDGCFRRRRPRSPPALPRTERRVGAEIEADALPFSRSFHQRFAKRSAPIRSTLALGGGEDYVLLFTLPAELAPPEEFACRRIGTITERPGVFLLQDGKRRELPDARLGSSRSVQNENPRREPGSSAEGTREAANDQRKRF